MARSRCHQQSDDMKERRKKEEDGEKEKRKKKTRSTANALLAPPPSSLTHPHTHIHIHTHTQSPPRLFPHCITAVSSVPSAAGHCHSSLPPAQPPVSLPSPASSFGPSLFSRPHFPSPAAQTPLMPALLPWRPLYIAPAPLHTTSSSRRRLPEKRGGLAGGAGGRGRSGEQSKGCGRRGQKTERRRRGKVQDLVKGEREKGE